MTLESGKEYRVRIAIFARLEFQITIRLSILCFGFGVGVPDGQFKTYWFDLYLGPLTAGLLWWPKDSLDNFKTVV